MTTSNPIKADPLLAANLGEWNEKINAYLELPFHQSRVKIALGMLREAFQKSAADQRSRGIEPARPRGIELGSSDGEIAVQIRDMGADIVACDGDEKALAVAREKHGLETKAFDISKDFPFEKNSLDFIYAGELIEHLVDTRKFLAECNRVLKPGGTLVLTTPNLATLRDRFRFLAGLSPRQIDPTHPYLWLHVRPFTGEMLKKCLHEAGFEETSLRSNLVGIPLPYGSGKVVESKLLYKLGVRNLEKGRKQLESKLLARRFPKLGGSLITSSQKPKPAPAPGF